MQVIEDARQREGDMAYFSTRPKPMDDAGRTIAASRLFRFAAYTPLRFDRARLIHFGAELFDRAVSKALKATDVFIGFVGQSLHSFECARRLGAVRLELQAANSHVDNVVRQHAKAERQFPIESPWIGEGQRAKTLREYDQADVIWVASEYTRRTFIDAGVAERKLARIHLRTAARFLPPADKPHDSVFRVVFVGNLTVGKGVPLLVSAFSRLTRRDAELVLVGGCSTRGMKRYLDQAMVCDPRIRISPGDPLPHLHRASVCVHATYEDGWAYAPAEAMACGVQVIVSQDTGMSELVREGVNGYVVPTGDEDALFERLEFLEKHGKQ